MNKEPLPLNAQRPIHMTLTLEEARVIQAAIYNGQLSGKLKTYSGMRPSKIAELATDLFDRINWLLDETIAEDTRDE